MATIFDDLFDTFRDNKDIISAGAGVLNFFQDRNEGKSLQNFARGSSIDPFGAGNRQHYQRRLADLYRDPSRIASLPGYSFARDQGEKGINRAAAARGEFFSGNAVHELTRFNQGLAGQFYDDEVKRLMELSGAGFSPNSAAAGSLYSQGAGLRTNSVGQLFAGANEGSSPLNALSNIGSLATKIPGVGPDFSSLVNQFFGGGAAAAGGAGAAGTIGTTAGLAEAAAGMGYAGTGAAAGGIGALGSAAGLSEAAAGMGYAGTTAAGGAGGAAAGSAGLTGLSSVAIPAAFALPVIMGIAGSFQRKAAKAKALSPLLQGIGSSELQNFPELGIRGVPFRGLGGENLIASKAVRNNPKAGSARAIAGVYNQGTGTFGSYGPSGFFSDELSDLEGRNYYNIANKSQLERMGELRDKQHAATAAEVELHAN